MSEQRPDPASDLDLTAADAARGSSPNGKHHDDATVAVADPEAQEAIDAGSEATAEVTGDAPAADADDAESAAVAADDAGTADAADAVAADATAGDEPDGTPDATPEVAADGADGADAADAADDGAAFLAELVRAMQTTAGAERARVGEDTDRRREAHLAAIQARRESEAQRMRELADADLAAIDAWAEEERQRIQAEHDRRAAALRDDLEVSLTQHGAQIDREVEAVEAAITTYRGEVDAFFTSLDAETDPVAIARHASSRPAFPALDAIGREAGQPTVADTAGAAAGAASEASEADGSGEPAVGVLDSTASARLAESWKAWSGQRPAATDEAAGDGTAAADASEEGEAARAATRGSSGGETPVLQSVPISRPMSWLRRDRDGDGDRS